MEEKVLRLQNSINNIIHFWHYKKTQIADNRDPAPVKIYEPSSDKVAWATAISNRGKQLPLEITFKDGEIWDCQTFPPTISFTTR